MATIRNKKRVILKGFAAFIYAMSLVFICAGIVGTHSILSNSFKNKEAVNNNLTKTVSTKELITSYQTLTKITTTTTNTTTVLATTAPKGEIQQFAHDLVVGYYGWTESDFSALVKLWQRESEWNPKSVNRSSGTCGIPQAISCNAIIKSYGDLSWESQVKWGLSYIKRRYKTPIAAWTFFQNNNWY